MSTKIAYIFLIALIPLASCKKMKAKAQKKKWIENAFKSLVNNEFPEVKAIAWWNENFEKTKLKIDASKKTLKAYKKGVSNPLFITSPTFVNDKLVAPTSGIYHSAYPDFGGTEDIVTTDAIEEFEAHAEKDIVWAYFSNNWYDNIHFPTAGVNTINSAGKVPFIRMMPRSNFDEGGPDPTYSMQKIIDGDFDYELTQWAIDASSIGIPLLVEFGTEVNGNWFSWNGQYNGGGTTSNYGDPSLADGPERFRDAYRHIIDICNTNGADNITWFFHVDAYSEPDNGWNIIENYYPGDGYIDWIGVSVYGPQERDADYEEFSDKLNEVYPTLVSLADKPIAVLEFGITE